MAESLPFRLILASASPARRYLLSRAGYSFEVKPSQLDEPGGEEFGDPRALVAHIAGLKAAAVARSLGEARPVVVLAADSLGWHAGKPIGKPADRADACRILTTLMGTRHQLWTGVCLWLLPGNIQIAWQEASTVEMSRLPDNELDEYLSGGRWEGCSGAYAIQETGEDPLVRVVDGTISNVIGLPMETLEKVLEWLAKDASAWPAVTAG
jgi:septum formation protein